MSEFLGTHANAVIVLLSNSSAVCHIGGLPGGRHGDIESRGRDIRAVTEKDLEAE